MTDFPPGESYRRNIELVGYADLQGRPGFKLALHKKAERWYLYTPSLWQPGLTILEVTEPSRPRFVRFIEGPANTWTLQVQIADGRMITSFEKIAPGWGYDPGKP